MDVGGYWVTSLGTLIHAAYEPALRQRFPNMEFEVKSFLPGATKAS